MKNNLKMEKLNNLVSQYNKISTYQQNVKSQVDDLKNTRYEDCKRISNKLKKFEKEMLSLVYFCRENNLSPTFSFPEGYPYKIKINCHTEMNHWPAFEMDEKGLHGKTESTQVVSKSLSHYEKGEIGSAFEVENIIDKETGLPLYHFELLSKNTDEIIDLAYLEIEKELNQKIKNEQQNLNQEVSKQYDPVTQKLNAFAKNLRLIMDFCIKDKVFEQGIMPYYQKQYLLDGLKVNINMEPNNIKISYEKDNEILPIASVTNLDTPYNVYQINFSFTNKNIDTNTIKTNEIVNENYTLKPEALWLFNNINKLENILKQNLEEIVQSCDKQTQYHHSGNHFLNNRDNNGNSLDQQIER